jgi:predicted aspartyl protease
LALSRAIGCCAFVDKWYKGHVTARRLRSLVPLLLLLLLLQLAEASPALEDAIPAVASPEPAAEAVLADLPFEPYHEANRVVLNLAPEGHKPFRLMLDTGAQTSVITPRMARSLGVSVRRLKQSPYRRATILGRDLQFRVNTRRGDTGSNVAFEYGLLGCDFLDDYVVEIDFPQRRVRFLDRKRYALPERVAAADERILPLRRIDTRIGAEIEMNERRGLVLLDTGAPGTLMLSGALARNLAVDVDSLEDGGRAQGTLGPVSVRRYETDSFRFAGFAFDAMPILVAPRGWYNIAGPTDSLLGYDVLSQFVIRIDFENRRMWLKRTGSHRITIYGADYQLSKRVGARISATPTGYSVWSVDPNGTAAAFGLRDGDQIVVPMGDAMIEIDAVLEIIERGGELTVAREEGGFWIDRILPDPNSSETSPPPSQPAREIQDAP